ncbi:thiamine pyrophosphate-binding protein [Halostella sp. JP-L12]|uniref:thiamine pyrophosphate-binding protein n=1 Tax=Halostella TaxID=1843185 RepID=UPI000EF84D6B|nr:MULTISPECIES: thiamine pyrophosphate-binding protein [Halostella]NHN49347.1 thiamine pyrophosphate-binding protein [Halostella sp. JP-L12]
MPDDDYTGADLFVDALEQYGVTHLFGNPGTTELPLMQSIAGSSLEYVLGLHEDIAVGMASGYAATRRYQSHREDVNPLGVVNLHVAPGLAHGLGNIQNAAWTGAPLLVTAGNHSTDFQHEEPILSGDLVEMAKEYCKWSAEVQDVSALPTMIRRAVRTALAPPTGPVFLGLPMDVMMESTDADPERIGAIPSGGRGDPKQIAAAAEALESADDPVLVLGDRVARSGHQAIAAGVELAEATGAAVYSEMVTCEINYPPDHDQWVSFVSPGPEMARTVFDADALVFVGCTTNTPYIPYDEPYIPDEATTIHVNADSWEIGKNQPADVAVVGDPGEVMSEIASAVNVTREEQERRKDMIPERREVAHEFLHTEREDRSDGSISKVALADALAETVPNSYVVNESNTSKYALLTRWQLEPEQFISNKNGGLGYGLPATVGAAVAMTERDDGGRPVVGFIGDGSYLYYPQSLYSAARYDLDLTVVVPDNRNYRILKDGMLNIFGGTDEDHEYVGMDFEPGVDLVENAESHGATGMRVTQRDGLQETLTEAAETDGPVVVDAIVHD